ncbi:MAG TPA: aminotransferase class I/II-fold pyridoxal phosphate-dependent enzyme [Gemmatimonadales bacterium]|nr:aminotransferase class I/II-fold pyridoxal phosphate-dependent enzyme [Gemmatimonadales bacterium]
MIRFSDRVKALPGYPLAEIPAIKRRLAAAGVDIIDLGAGDNDMPPPAPVIDTMSAAVRTTALSKYGFQQGLPEYRQAAVRWVARRFGIEFDPMTESLPLIGSKEGLMHLTFAVVNPGDVAIVPEPGYQAYIGGALLSGAEPYIAPLRAERSFLLELDDVPEDVLRRAKIVFVNYPNNPTAAVATPDYLERTVAACRRHGILLAYDNAYCDLTFDGYRAPSIFETSGAREIAVEFFSLSKSFSMTGWRIGFAVGARELIGAFTRVKSYVDTGPWLAVQKAGAAALDAAERLVQPVREELERRRDAAVPALRGVGYEVESPKAAMYLWVPLPRGVASAVFARRALEEHGVVVLPGSGFGPAGEGYFRIALTVGAERLAEAAGRLGALLERVRRGELATSA